MANPTNPKTDAAVRLARKGFRVFPVRQDDPSVPPNEIKRPALPESWTAIATSDEAAVREMWRQPYNSGVMAGEDLLIIDVDVRNDGHLAWKFEAETINDTPDTYMVTTTTGGTHLYFRMPAGAPPIRTGTHAFARGVDVKHGNGYVVGAGSTIHGKPYVEHDHPIAEAPAWLIEHLARRAKERKAAPPEEILVEPDLPHNIARGRTFLEEDAPEAIEGAGGDDTTVKKVAMPLRDRAISQGMALELMLDHWNETKAIPPWAPDELEKKVASAYKSAERAFGAALPEAEFEPVEVAEPVRERKSRDGIRTVDWLTLITEEVEEEPDYIEPNFAGAGNLVLLAGPPKAQKSFLLQEMLVACATGGDFLAGTFTVPRPLRVFNLQAEMNRKLLRKRARLVGLDDLSEEQRRMLRSNLKVSERFHMLLDANGVRTAIATIKACYPDEPPDIIAVDPLANVYDQESEDNTPQMMQFLTNRLGKIRQAINPHACIVLVHHSKKCSPEDLARDPFNAIRGAGALRGYYDSAVVIFRKGEESKLRRVHFELRSGESPPPVEVEFVGGRFHTREPGAEIDRETARNILKAIDEAWKNDNPWSHYPQAKASGRHATRLITGRFGMDARSAAYLVDQWLMDGVIAHRPRTRSRPAGLEVTGSIEDSLFQNVTPEHSPNSENRKNSETSAARKGVQKRAAARRGRR